MSAAPPSDEEKTWRRRFASRANNRAWSLTEQSSRTTRENQEMLHAAHASMHLWSTIGTERNLALAQLLLGQVHALLGNAHYALPYAEAAHTYFISNASEPCDVAMSHAIMAAAAHSAGNLADHEANYRAAEVLIATLSSAEDKAILEATMNVVPKPLGNAAEK